MSGRRRRVAAIGLDSADRWLVDKLLAAGDLPNLAGLRSRSAVAELENPDFRTGLGWEHFIAGKRPPGCGRWAAIDFDPGTYDTWQTGARPLEPFYATDPPTRAILFDLPYMSLLHAVPGVQVTDWGGHDPGYPPAANPAGLHRQIVERFGHHPAAANCYEVVWNRPEAIDALGDALVVGAQRRAAICEWLQSREPDWELFMTVFTEPHSANEAFWHGVDDDSPVAVAGTVEQAGARIRDVYRAVDAALGRILAALPDDTTVVVFSLFGSSRNEVDVPSMVLLPELLHRLHTGEQYLRQPDSLALVVPPADTSWPHFMECAVPSASDSLHPLRQAWRAHAPAWARRAYRQAHAAAGRRRKHQRPAGNGVTLGALGRPIPPESNLTADQIGVMRTSVDWQVPMRYHSVWPTMRAFALPTFYDGRIRINLAGRERDGIVALADYGRVCDEIEHEVAQCRNPRTGEPVLAEVNRLRVDDPMRPHGPDADLQLIWTGWTDSWDHPVAGRIGPFPNRRTGGHSSRGFAYVAGPEIAARDLGSRSYLDVTATILALLGRPADRSLEGQPLPV